MKEIFYENLPRKGFIKACYSSITIVRTDVTLVFEVMFSFLQTSGRLSLAVSRLHQHQLIGLPVTSCYITPVSGSGPGQGESRERPAYQLISILFHSNVVILHLDLF